MLTQSTTIDQAIFEILAFLGYIFGSYFRDLGPELGFAPYYMGPKHTGELWVYIGTPLPNPTGNTGVMVCYVFHVLKRHSCDFQKKIGF